MKQNSNISLNKTVFYPTFGFLSLVILYSLIDNEGFLNAANAANDWILDIFGWLFTWSSFFFLLILLAVYFSPIAKMKIGGKQAKPLLSKWKWFTIALCTTVATGILFWGPAEPLYHLHTPPSSSNIAANSPSATDFAMSTLFMHWSFTPYGIYTITGLVFALAYYNFKQPFSIGSLFFPLSKSKKYTKASSILDIICLSGLVSGMAASLGTGIFALSGGLETTLNMEKSNLLLGIIGFAIVVTFILSAISGLKKGISFLSFWNTIGFFLLAAFIFLIGPTLGILKIGGEGMLDYGQHFISRSTNVGGNIDKGWLNNWTVFYFANWFAWAPVSALFLGRLSVGYTVRDFINFNLLYPSLFSCGWMVIFGGAALFFDQLNGGALYQTLITDGEENVLYQLFSYFPISKEISLFALLLIFISYVTIADSNVSAMSAISTTGIQPEHPEAPLWIKITWGSMIGIIAWIMITGAGIDGIRMLCVLGGFPALFIIIFVGLGLVKLLFSSKKSLELN